MSLRPDRLYLVLCTQAVEGGAWIRLRELLDHLEERGVDHALVTWETPEVRALADRHHLTVAAIPAPPRRRNALRLAWGVRRRLRRLRVPAGRTVWAGSFAGLSGLGIAWAWPRREGGALVFSFLRGVELERAALRQRRRGRLARWIRLALHRWAMRTALGRADLLLAQTPEGLAEVRREYPGAVPEATAVLPNNLDAVWIRRRLAEALREPGPALPPDRFHLCFVGRLRVRVKGLDTLVAALARLADLPVELHVVGGGEGRAELERLVTAAGVGDRVHLHGPRDNPLRMMARCDLVVVPSRSEGMPNVVLEALAVGRPVIGSTVPGIRRVLEHDDLLFPAADADRLAALVRRAATDRGHRERLERLCRERAAAFEFDWGERFLQHLAEATPR